RLADGTPAITNRSIAASAATATLNENGLNAAAKNAGDDSPTTIAAIGIATKTQHTGHDRDHATRRAAASASSPMPTVVTATDASDAGALAAIIMASSSTSRMRSFGTIPW